MHTLMRIGCKRVGEYAKIRFAYKNYDDDSFSIGHRISLL